MSKKLKSELRHLCKNDANAKRIFEMWSKHERSREVSTLETIAKNSQIEYLAAVKVMKELDGLEIGRFIVGRREYKTRFEFWYDRKVLGKAALGNNKVELEPWFEEDDEESYIDALIELHRALLAKAANVDISEVKISCG